MSFTVSINTLGCRVNQYESSLLALSLESSGAKIVSFGEECDFSVINTCTVTSESDRKSRQLIRRAVNKAKKGVFVTGCFAEISPEEVRKIDGVIAVVGNKNKSILSNLIVDYAKKGLIETSIECNKFEKCTGMLKKPGRVRTFIKIEDGCESRCAYCIIPKARGPIRSKSPDVILEEAKVLTSSGSPEIILTGIEISAYGKDFKNELAKYDLSNLLTDLSAIQTVKRIGLGSLDPTLMTEEFLLRISKIPQLIRHFHISLQSGCSSILARMRRKYNADQAQIYIQRIKKYFPDANISADIIVGFPGESDDEFNKTVDFCNSIDFLNLHVFPYSIREGTEAAVMPYQVPEQIKKERVSILEKLHADKRNKLMEDYCDKRDAVNVLFEQKKNGYLIGHSEHYVEFKVDGPCDLVGEICSVKPQKDGFGILIDQ